MSYILDALKKSEAERSRGSVPTLLTSEHTHFKSNTTMWLLLGALIVNACLFGAWIYLRDRPTPAAVATSMTEPHEAPAAVVTPTPVNSVKREASPAIVDPAPPQFAFSTHVYADDPTMRAVTLNGRRFVEGYTISPGVVLQEITETGVVLDMNGGIVAVDVLQDWR